MNATETMTRRQWAQLVGLGLMLAVVFVMAVAIVLPAAALALTLALLVVGATLVAQRVSSVARSVRSAASGERPAAGPAQPALLLELADGTVVHARPVPISGASEHTLALTRDGYVVLSAEGKLLHRL